MARLSHPFIVELKRFVANQNATLGPMVLLLSDIMAKPSNSFKQADVIKLKQKKLSEITDMIHAAHVFHRCVRDDISLNFNDNNSKRLHQDNIMSLLVGDYLLAQSSVDMADLRFPRTVGLIAKGLEDYTRGEFLKLKLIEAGNQESDMTHQIIEQHAELTCGSLLSNACLSSALLGGYDDNIPNSDSTNIVNLVFRIGHHVGTAHRLLELLYHPSANSEEERVLVDSLDSERFVKSIRRHISRSIDLLQDIKNSEKKLDFLTLLKKMDDKCFNKSQL